ncbi:hypothetical protein TELCIR_05613 [Teladorsagia circumcincta]|uniref:Hexosyltransferase n=1 Tax=Teladorsagia circumcincta TaxID=45464 RepID=A0A2G9UQP0_TELCI|nr:hypothetical protein TELCIR_05613 [Teladorsagia circumcincta]
MDRPTRCDGRQMNMWAHTNWAAEKTGPSNPVREEESHAKSTTFLVRQMFQNVSFRDRRLEVTDYLIVPPPGFCKKSIFIVIVPVKVDDNIRRDDWRSSYARPAIQRKYWYSVLFAVGLPKSQEIQRKLYLESQLYGDVLQANFEDVYQNLTRKVLSALRFVFPSCPQAKAFIKIDDDAGWNIIRTNDLVLHHLDYNKVYGQL